MVSAASLAVMVFGGVFILAMVIILAVFFRKKYQTKLSAFFIGAATFFVFALVLEQIMHWIILFQSPAGEKIQNNIWLYALYGGFAAGIFEECGRLVSMKFLMKKHRDNDYNGLMYGAGHGGCEALLVAGLSMATNFIYSILINLGQESMLTSQVPAEQKETVTAALTQLKEASPALFLAVPIERVSAVITHIALSALVWIAVTRKKTLLFPLAIFLHALLDAVCVLLKDNLNIFLLEGIIFAMSAAFALLARVIWKKNVVPAANDA